MEEITKITYKKFIIKFFYKDRKDSSLGYIYSIYNKNNRITISVDSFETVSLAEIEAKKVIDEDNYYINYYHGEENKNNIEPSHYGGKGNIYEAIKIIQHYKLDFCLGNAVKYVIRAGKKDPTKEIEDLQKAKWYIETKIKELEDAKVNLNKLIDK